MIGLVSLPLKVPEVFRSTITMAVPNVSPSCIASNASSPPEPGGLSMIIMSASRPFSMPSSIQIRRSAVSPLAIAITFSAGMSSDRMKSL